MGKQECDCRALHKYCLKAVDAWLPRVFAGAHLLVALATGGTYSISHHMSAWIITRLLKNRPVVDDINARHTECGASHVKDYGQGACRKVVGSVAVNLRAH